MIFLLCTICVQLILLLLYSGYLVSLLVPSEKIYLRRVFLLERECSGGERYVFEGDRDFAEYGFSLQTGRLIASSASGPSKESGPGKNRILIRCEGSALSVRSGRPVMIGGVRRREGVLKPGAILRFGSCRMRFLGFPDRDGYLKSRDDDGSIVGRGLRAAILTVCIGLAAGTAGILGATAAPAVQPAADAVSTTQGTDPVAHEPVPARVQAAPSFRVVKPGAIVPDMKVDILFLHAHPDDESIDFGSLIAHCSDAGLRSAVVIFTDGENGIFQHLYDGPRNNLAKIRIGEAEKALRILGSSLYIRLGLPNHPYNGTAQEISVSEVLDLWGGEDHVRQTVRELLLRLRPRIVVAPDRPSAAREHFEHEAVGTVVADVIESLRESGDYAPEGYLVCVDPRQHELYPDAIPIPRTGALERQEAALKSHRTQADASLFGVEMIEEFENEYYHVRDWSIDELPQSYFLH